MNQPWAALAAERNLLRTLIDNLPDYIFAKDREDRFLISNLAHARAVLATTPEELVGKTAFDFFPPELAAQYRADDEAVMQSGQPLISMCSGGSGREGLIIQGEATGQDTQLGRLTEPNEQKQRAAGAADGKFRPRSISVGRTAGRDRMASHATSAAK